MGTSTDIDMQYEKCPTAQFETNLIEEEREVGGGGDKIKLKRKPQRQNLETYNRAALTQFVGKKNFSDTKPIISRNATCGSFNATCI